MPEISREGKKAIEKMLKSAEKMITGGRAGTEFGKQLNKSGD